MWVTFYPQDNRGVYDVRLYISSYGEWTGKAGNHGNGPDIGLYDRSSVKPYFMRGWTSAWQDSNKVYMMAGKSAFVVFDYK